MTISSPALAARPGFIDELGSEWAKLRTVRSASWTLAAMAACVVGIAVFVGATESLQPDDTVLGARAPGHMRACNVGRPGLDRTWSGPG